MSRYAGRRVLVTGGFGFLGSALVKALVGRGAYVRVLDDASRGTPASLEEAMRSGKVELIHGDVRDSERVRQAVRGVAAVHHLAYVNGTQRFYTQPAHVLDVGVKGMVNVIDACLDEGVEELLLVSSSEVYQTPSQIPTDETVPLSIPDPLNSRYSYGGGKIISELMAINYGREYFRRVLIVRPHNVFGPRMGKEHVIPQLIDRLLALRTADPEETIRLPIQGSGEQTRAFIFIDDFTEALCMVLERGEHLNIYHLGTMEERSITGVAQAVAQAMNVTIQIVPGPEAPGGTRRRCPDTGKLTALGFRPRFSFDEALRITVDWYLSQQQPQDDALETSARSPIVAESPRLQSGKKGEAGVAAKPGRQGTGEVEHGFDAVPPHGRQQEPRASAYGATQRGPRA